ncbi:MAG: sigma-70 family RNA polymerase sigma factor [Deltaproteobacteria bacterium]|jgi:RNA polymerase sigma-70 factor (ECF subfamily)
MPPTKPSSQDVGLRLVKGQAVEPPDEGPATFEECFSRYHRLVATIGLRMLGRKSEVDDFVQDVFLEVHRGFGKLRDRRAAKGWVRSIAVRVAIKRLRRLRLAATFGLDQPIDLDAFFHNPRQEHATLLLQVYRTLDDLPAKARVVWVLRFIEGEKLEDIAKLTDMGLSTVKRLLAAAQARIQAAVDA